LDLASVSERHHMQPLVMTVILNTNRRADTLACLESLAHSNYPNHRAIVLDNASTDGSVEAIRAAFPDVTVIALQENRGYAGNNNVGVRVALEQGAEWVLVLNEDTLVAADMLSRLVAAAERAEIGIVGPLVYHADEPQVIQTAGGVLDRHWRSFHQGLNELDRGQYVNPRPVDWVSGCAIMVRRQVIEQVGAIDERYFYYWEETEWCLRARRAGWQIWIAPQAKMWHKGVQRNYQPGPNITYYATRNRLLTLSKHRAPLSARASTLAGILRTLAAWSLKPRWRSMRAHRDAMWQGMLDFVRHRWGIRAA
jgi:GT2 family glycosyltransferase